MEESSNQPTRKTADLRKGRASITGARYFVTLTTANRSAGLTMDTISPSLKDCLRQLQQDEDIDLHCGTFMPDHVHLLFTLGQRLSLSQIIQKFKSQSKPALNSHQLKWQANYFEHRLRPDVELENFALYIFLNPYRRKLLALNEEWPDWILNRNYKPLFIQNLRDSKYPQVEWLQNELRWEDLVPSQ